MELTWNTTTDGIDWHELSELFRLAPLGNKSAEHLKTVFTNSRYVVFAYMGGRLAGAGRSLGDGLDAAYLCDIAVHPDHQGKGVGQAILTHFLKAASGHKKVLLYAAPGKEGFYQRNGFLKMRTALARFTNPTGAINAGLVEEPETRR